MKILSVVWAPCSTAALLIDGRIVACVSEERFSRIKNDDTYPKRAIESVLSIGRVRPRELDLIAIAGEDFDAKAFLCHKWSRFSIQDRIKEQMQYWYPRIYQNKDISFLDIFRDKIDTAQFPGQWDGVVHFLKHGDPKGYRIYFQEFRRKIINKHLGTSPEKIIFTNHHRSHAYYAYYASPIKREDVLILTADAWGDNMNASVSIAKNKQIKVLSTSDNFIIGRLYRYMTLLLGMKPDEHEYKVMGLAGYAQSEYYQAPLAVFKETMYVDGLGFSYKKKPPDLYFYFRDSLEGWRFDAIAAAIQKYTEDILVEWTRNALKATKANKVCFGGGVAMNIKAIMEIAKLPKLADIFICPSPSDESLAIGAAYVAAHDLCVSRKQNPFVYLKPLKDAYLGPDINEGEIKLVLKKARSLNYAISLKPNLKYITKLLINGKIIGRCIGRSEFGARALGNRSIIADPRDIRTIRVINEKIKCRDFWMPFAPSLLDKKVDNYLVNPKGLRSPYMTVAFETKPLARKDLSAAIHQYDFTVRPQIVTDEENPEYYKLLLEFNNLTGIGGLLNTSFNIHGEPIVQTAQDAFDVFQCSKLDALLLNGYLINK